MGRSKMKNTVSTATHASQKRMVKGSIRAMTVPRPAWGSYLRSMVSSTIMYGFSGVRICVAESPTRNAPWMKAGSNPSRANMGTNTDAIRVHMAEPEMMNRFSTEASRMKPRIAG
jgi:hypothetical protein